jgi:hypothetical protein
MLTRRGTQGQSLVEFALILPLFMLLFFGIVDGARLVYTNSQLGQAAREGARVAASSVGSTDLSCVASESLITSARPGAHVCPINEAALKADVVAAVQRMTVGLGPFDATNVFLACDSGGAAEPTATPTAIPADPAPTGAWTETGANKVTYPECSDPSGKFAAPNGPGSLVSVRITYQYTAITPIVSSIFGTVNLSASATMVIN